MPRQKAFDRAESGYRDGVTPLRSGRSNMENFGNFARQIRHSGARLVDKYESNYFSSHEDISTLMSRVFY